MDDGKPARGKDKLHSILKNKFGGNEFQAIGLGTIEMHSSAHKYFLYCILITTDALEMMLIIAHDGGAGAKRVSDIYLDPLLLY